jgi:hypothetical protein
MVFPGKAVAVNGTQNLFDQAAHRLMHKIAIIDAVAHLDPLFA